jgi:hypothetical protein
VEVRTSYPIKKIRVKPTLEFQSLRELRDYRVRDVPLGAMVYSTIASIKRSTAISLNDDSDLIKHFLDSARNMLAKLEIEITENDPDIIISINDRVLGSALTVALARKWNIPVSIVYWGSSPNKIIDYHDSLYDSNQWQRNIKDKWDRKEYSELDLVELRREIEGLTIKPSTDSLTFL